MFLAQHSVTLNYHILLHLKTINLEYSIHIIDVKTPVSKTVLFFKCKYITYYNIFTPFFRVRSGCIVFKFT